MQVEFDITQPIIEQSIRLFKLLKTGEKYAINPEIGNGGEVSHQLFPGKLEFYHFGRTIYQVPITMKSVNPHDSSWFLIHINLSNVQQNKVINEDTIEFHKYRPAGILLYGPGLEINTFFPTGTEAEVCGIRFSRKLLSDYLGEDVFKAGIDKPLTYEDLDADLEFLLMDALSNFNDKLIAHACVLKFLQAFFVKLRRHDSVGNAKHLHSKDYSNLLKASSSLRDPVSEKVPSLDELANQAEMSLTKFKITFKQVFGCAPMQFRNKIRLQYAREQLRTRRKTPVELSHELGYTHPSNFTAAYKKHFKVLPSQESG